MKYCLCHGVVGFKSGLKDVIDEVKELVEEPSLDELSDVVYGINRVVGGLFGKQYLRVLSGDKLHIEKIDNRMNEYGCIRSKRHLANGKCPSEIR